VGLLVTGPGALGPYGLKSMKYSILFYSIRTWPTHSPDLTTLDNSLCAVSREGWLHITTPSMRNCAELWKTPFAPLLHKCCHICNRGQRGASTLCAASRCTAHVAKQVIKVNYDCTLLHAQ